MALAGAERGNQQNMPFTVLVVDDHPVVRSGVCGLISRTFEGCEILEAACLADALQVLSEHANPDMILCDLTLPDSGGLATIEAILQASPRAVVVVLTASEESGVADMVRNVGAKAFLSKTASPSELAAALRKLAPRLASRSKGRAPTSASHGDDAAGKLASLPPRAAQVAKLCASGITNKGIARELGISENTVRAHVSVILQRLALRSRIDIARLGLGKTGSARPDDMAED